MASFGKILKALREKAGLTQAELSERAGINRTSLARLETDVFTPAWPTVQSLAKALGVSCEAFQAEEPANEPRKSSKSKKKT
jgi:transcriptional regulator with XRE-family HTH domain